MTMASFLPILLLLANPIFSLPGPSDVTLTHKPASFLQNLKRQFTGLGPFPMPPPDRCYRRTDKSPACPYGGQCRPDLKYTCQTYCVSYGQTLDNQMSCNLPCSYEATGLAGERPINPMHCAALGERSRISCESGWACYRQFSEVAPAFEQRAPVCSPRYEECDLDDGTAAPAPAPTEEGPAAPVQPVAPLEPAASTSAASASESATAAAPTTATTAAPAAAAEEPPTPDEADDASPASTPAVIIISVNDSDDNDRRRKRQASTRLTCKPNFRCLRDPRPSLSLPARKDSPRGICVPETAKRCTPLPKGGVWTECGERGHCAEAASTDSGAATAGEGLCVPLLGADWVDSPAFGGVTVANVSVKAAQGLRPRGVLRPMC